MSRLTVGTHPHDKPRALGVEKAHLGLQAADVQIGDIAALLVGLEQLIQRRLKGGSGGAAHAGVEGGPEVANGLGAGAARAVGRLSHGGRPLPGLAESQGYLGIRFHVRKARYCACLTFIPLYWKVAAQEARSRPSF
jgi:hypothetical protein